MRTISDSRARPLASILVVLGGSVLLSACSSPNSPSAADFPVAADLGRGTAGAVRSSKAGGIRICPTCRNIIEVSRGPAKVILGLYNEGDENVGAVQVWGYLLAPTGERIPVSETEHGAPHPGDTIVITVELQVPSKTPAGPYHVLMTLSPESKDPTDTWISDEVLWVASEANE